MVALTEKKGMPLQEAREDYEALGRVEDAIRERKAAIKSKEEETEVVALLNRGFSPKCAWDRKHYAMLVTLAVKPQEVSWYFKFREPLHRMIHDH